MIIAWKKMMNDRVLAKEFWEEAIVLCQWSMNSILMEGGLQRGISLPFEILF